MCVGGRLLFPAGDFVVTSQVELTGTDFEILGDNSTFDASSIASGLSSPILIGDDLSNFSIKGIKFKGGNSTGLAAGSGTKTVMLRFLDCSDFLIEGCTVLESFGPAIALKGCRYYRIIGNFISRCGRDGIFTTNSDSRRQEVGVIANNTAIQCGDDAYTINGALGVTEVDDQAYNISLVGNTYIGHSSYHSGLAGRGILVYGAKNCSVVGNNIKNTYSFGILVRSDTATTPNNSKNVTITGNTIAEAGIAGDGAQPQEGIRLDSAIECILSSNVISNSYSHGIKVQESSDLMITSNVVESSGQTTTDDGISINGSVSRAVINDNTVFDSERSGIYIGATTTDNITASGNRCYNNGRNASATSSTRSGIRVESTGVVELKDNSCYGTTGVTSQQFGISANSAASALYESGNTAYSNASSDFSINAAAVLIDATWRGRNTRSITNLTGATPSVANNSTFTHAGGGATITNLTNGTAGQEITVIFTGSATVDFTANANMVGNGGSDWSATSGDLMQCSLDASSAWHCIVGNT